MQKELDIERQLLSSIQERLEEGRSNLLETMQVSNVDNLKVVAQKFNNWVLSILAEIKQKAAVEKSIKGLPEFSYHIEGDIFETKQVVKFAVESNLYYRKVEDFRDQLLKEIKERENETTYQRFVRKLTNQKLVAVLLIVVAVVFTMDGLYDIGKKLWIDTHKTPSQARVSWYKMMGIEAALKNRNGSIHSVTDEELNEMIGDNITYKDSLGRKTLTIEFKLDDKQKGDTLSFSFDPNFYNKLGGNKLNPEGWASEVIPGGRRYTSIHPSNHLTFFITEID